MSFRTDTGVDVELKQSASLPNRLAILRIEDDANFLTAFDLRRLAADLNDMADRLDEADEDKTLVDLVVHVDADDMITEVRSFG